MSMIPHVASSCARKTISRSTEQWRIFVKTWFVTFVSVIVMVESSRKTANFTLHVVLCYNLERSIAAFPHSFKECHTDMKAVQHYAPLKI